jgi:coatomer subunit delta
LLTAPQNKELEASEERKRKAKQLEMQRKEMSRSSRGAVPRAPSYPTYTPPSAPQTVPDTYESYKAEQTKSSKPLTTRGKGMQLGKKGKKTDMFGDVAPEADLSAPLVTNTPSAPTPAAPASARESLAMDREAVHIVIAESINAKLSREGSLESFDVKGDLQLRISDPALTQVKLDLSVGDLKGAQLTSHPKVDKNLFRASPRVIQLSDASKGFPANNSIGVMRWKVAPSKPSDIGDPPINFTVWVNDAGGNTFNFTIEYEWTGPDPLKDVTVSIPFQTAEPSVSSFDAVYEVSGDTIDWVIGTVDEENSSGSFECEALADSDAEFFPMSVRFSKTQPYVEVDVSHFPLQLVFCTCANLYPRLLPSSYSAWARTSTSPRRSSRWLITT